MVCTQVNAGFIRLLGMNRPEWLWAVVGTAGSAGLGIMYPAFGLALSNIIGVFYNTDHAKMESTVQTWCIVFAAVGGFALICATVQQYALTLMGQRLTKRLRVLLMQALLRQVCCICGGWCFMLVPQQNDRFVACSMSSLSIWACFYITAAGLFVQCFPGAAPSCRFAVHNKQCSVNHMWRRL